MKGLGTDEDTLIEIMCSLSNREIHEVCKLYETLYHQKLEKHMQSETSGNFKNLLTSLSVGGRDEYMVTDVTQAKLDAQSLKKAGIDKFGTDESEFNRILCSRNYEQLKLIAQEYQSLTGKSLSQDIISEFSGDIKESLLTILRIATNRAEYFASRFHKSMHGAGTNDTQLIRLCVTRCEIDMIDVKEEFQKAYSQTLKSYIQGDTSGA